jgi:hypothetical protein
MAWGCYRSPTEVALLRKFIGMKTHPAPCRSRSALARPSLSAIGVLPVAADEAPQTLPFAGLVNTA